MAARLAAARTGGELLAAAEGLPRAWPNRPSLQCHALHCLARLPGGGGGAGAAGALAGPRWARVLAELEGASGHLDARDLAKALMALAKVARAGVEGAAPPGGLLRALQQRCEACRSGFDARGASNAVYALGLLGAGAEPRALHALEARLGELGPELNPQDCANALWGFAKSGWLPSEALLGALGGALRARAAGLKAPELSMSLWALAALGIEDAAGRELARFLFGLAPGRELSAQAVANIAWAAGKLGLGPDGEEEGGGALVAAVDHLGRQAAARLAEGKFTPQGLANATWGLCRAGGVGAAGALLSNRQLGCLADSLGPVDVADLLWAAGRVRLRGPNLALLVSRARACVPEMTWQDLGHVEYALHAGKAGKYGAEDLEGLEVSMGERMAVLLEGVTGGGARAGAVHEWFWGRNGETLARDLSGKSVLLVGGGEGVGALAKKLERAGARKVRTWSRFASSASRVEARPWPKKGKWEACIMHAPLSKDMLAMAAHAVASRMRPGDPLWAYGASPRAGRTASLALKDLFDVRQDVAPAARGQGRTSAAGGGYVLRCSRSTAAEARASLQAWSTSASVRLLGAPCPWVTYPGLFSGGVLDPMSRLLIENLPRPGRGRKVLDFCCGSGIIAGAVREREPSAELTLLDADAAALEAAKANVPSATVLLSDGWTAVPETEKFATIVSNPPVHVGAESDFGVLKSLLELAPRHLEPGGYAFVVVQCYVPLKAILAASRAASLYKKVKLAAADGKFSVWKLKAAKPGCGRGGGDAGPAPRKRRKR